MELENSLNADICNSSNVKKCTSQLLKNDVVRQMSYDDFLLTLKEEPHSIDGSKHTKACENKAIHPKSLFLNNTSVKSTKILKDKQLSFSQSHHVFVNQNVNQNQKSLSPANLVKHTFFSNPSNLQCNPKKNLSDESQFSNPVFFSLPSSSFLVLEFSDFHLSKVMNVEVILNNLVSEYPDFPTIRCFQHLKACINNPKTNYSDGFLLESNDPYLLWADKFTPTTCAAVLSNCSGVIKFQRWLERWKMQTHSLSRMKKKKQESATYTNKHKKKRIPASLSDSSEDEFAVQKPILKRLKREFHPANHSVPSGSHLNCKLPIGYNIAQADCCCSSTSSEYEDNSTSDEEVSSKHSNGKFGSSWKSKAILLIGPHGIGKSALVYALANDLGFKVFELNASSRRSGKDIASQFQVALDSHHVAKENLCKTYSTFHMTNNTKPPTASSKSKLKVSQRTSFFEPRSRSTTTNFQPLKKQLEDAKGLNLNCQSIVLFDEVDVLFESDRGFWSGLSNLLHLARRPVVLTASDPMIVRNLPVPATVCYIEPPSLNLTIPYLRVLGLVEGLDLDKCTATSIIETKSQLSSKLPHYLSFDYCDLRQLINKLQWLSVSSSLDYSESETYNRKSSLSEFLNDPILWFTHNHSLLSSLQGYHVPKRNNTGIGLYTKQIKVKNNLSEIFDTDNGIDNTEELIHHSECTVKSINENTDNDCVNGNSTAGYKEHYSTRVLNILKYMTDNLSFLDVSRSLIHCSHISSFVNSVSDISEFVSGLLNNDNFNSFVPVTSSFVSKIYPANLSTLASSTGSTNIFLPGHSTPIPPFDTINDELLDILWPQLILSQSERQLLLLEEHIKSDSFKCISDLHAINPSVFSRDEHYKWSKCMTDLSRFCVAGMHKDYITGSHFKASVCDYLPCLRILAAGEATKQEISEKRRFLHYFDRISLYLHSTTRQFLANSVMHNN